MGASYSKPLPALGVEDQIDPDQVKRDFDEYQEEETRRLLLRRPSPLALEVFAIPEILEQILSHLESKDLLFAAPLVCRQFRDVIRSSTVLKEPMFLATNRRRENLTVSEAACVLFFTTDHGFGTDGWWFTQFWICNIGRLGPVYPNERREPFYKSIGLNPHLHRLCLDLPKLADCRHPAVSGREFYWSPDSSVWSQLEPDSTPIVMAGRQYAWYLSFLGPKGYDPGYNFDSHRYDNFAFQGAFYMHIVAVKKSHPTLLYGSYGSCTVMEKKSTAGKMFPCNRRINIPVFVVVSIHHDHCDGLLRDFQEWIDDDNSDFDLPDEPPDTVFAVRHIPGGQTHVIPWEWEQDDFGDVLMEDADFSGPYIDDSFSPDISYAELLDWAEDKMELHLKKTREASQDPAADQNPLSGTDAHKTNRVRQQLNSHMI